MSSAGLSAEATWHVIAEVMQLSHFIAVPPLCLQWQHVAAETTPWEIFRGQLVPAHLTRETRTFECWNLFAHDETGRSGEPLLSIKLDSERGELHVVRGLLCYVWEGYDAGNNVYLSREVQRWVRELVGTLSLQTLRTDVDLQSQLALLLRHAVVGSSRLPLTSVEAPLPAWSLGRLAFFHDGLEKTLTVSSQAPKVLEWLLRSSSPQALIESVNQFLTFWTGLAKTPQDTLTLLRAMFNEVSLSPYTDFVDKTLEFVRLLVAKSHLSVEQHVDFLGWLLRQLARHLTAYDLVTFHHRGANYPDALLLDAVLKDYLRLLEQHPALFTREDNAGRKRRRALRHGWLHRRRYEGHPVPDAPTSPGENMRVLPPPHVRVPEEQILNLSKRKKRLYAGDPLPNHIGPHGKNVLQQCGHDLRQSDELCELGMAIFIERPLGAVKAPGEPDLSPLLAHEAYSRSLAERALMELAREPLLRLTADDVSRCQSMLQTLLLTGISANSLPTDPPRVVSLADAAKAANDFVILRTLPGSVRMFCAMPDVAVLMKEAGINLDEESSWLIVANITASGKPRVVIRDGLGKQVLQLEVDAAQDVKRHGH